MSCLIKMNGRSEDLKKILLFIPMYNCEKHIIRVLNQLNSEVCNFFIRSDNCE